MKTMRRKRHVGRFLVALAVACSVGLYVGHSLCETVRAQEDAQVHIVDQGETLWEIAGPIADERGIDIREVIYIISVNNNIAGNDDIHPGQRLVINF
jgi:hypothetical protein